MDLNKIKELIQQGITEIIKEEGNTSSSVGSYLTKFAFKKPIKQKSINEVRYSQFKNNSKTRSPQEQLHMGVKEMQRKLDEINKLVDFTARMKNELKGDAEEMNLLKRTHNSLFKINEKIQEINDKIKDLTS
tara:strand:- start:151 stop:546 length:396 start_codon:yes stop_codon:yes gene_type:complete